MNIALTSKRSRCGTFDDVERSTLLKSVCVNRANCKVPLIISLF